MSRNSVAEAGQTRILVIDDDPRIRQIIQGTLEEEGFLVETAADGPQGVERALSTRPALVVLDMHLPILDGAAVAEQLRAPTGTGPPIILVTANDRPEEQAQRVGAAAYLRKPFDLDDLLRLVWQGLEMLPG